MSDSELFKRIELLAFPEDQYFREETDKYQIYVHHTVSPGHTAKGDIQHWLSTTSRIATHVIITQDGTIYQLFNSKYWAHHLGVRSDVFAKYGINDVNNLYLNKHSLSIELDSLGPVDVDGNSLVYGPSLKSKYVVAYDEPYRGYTCYEGYYPKQIESLELLLRFWCSKYDIPTTYNQNMWDVNADALSGKPGIWSHTSVRIDKSDLHPQPELIDMLKSL